MRAHLRRARRAAIVAAVTVAGALGASEAVPASWLRATPAGDPTAADTLVILGFGYETGHDGSMQPGETNRFLLAWALAKFPHVTTAFVQEGVWTAACPQAKRQCTVGTVTLHRIDRHDPNVDLHTPAIAVCTIERMVQFGKHHAILVAQPLQLGRAASDFGRAAKRRCRECTLAIPDVPDAPYPARSAQWRTRSEWLYKPVDLVALAIDALPGSPAAPESCPMPLPPGE